MQKRVANIAISASTLRNQGAAGVVESARKYLSQLSLGIFQGISTENQFMKILDDCTDELMQKMPKGARNWGTARKAINVFLEETLYNGCLNEIYALNNIAEYFEVPLDNYVAKNLIKEDRNGRLPSWQSIKRLNPETSAIFQSYAREVANDKGTIRIYLDLMYWR